MKKEVKYIDIEVKILDENGGSSIVGKTYTEKFDDRNIAFSDACSDLVQLEELGFLASIEISTFCVMEEIDL